MSNQLIKTTGLGKENVFPRTKILDLFDDTSGLKLIDILKSFNMMFVPYLWNKPYTRNQISPELRRQGLWLTYVIDNTVYTEWYDEVAIDDTNWGSDSNWRQGSNALVGDLSVSPNGTWVINGEDSGITIKGDKGDSPVIRIYNNKILVSYDKGITYEDLNNTPVYTKFRFNSLTNTYLVSYDLGANWLDISDEKVYHKFKYNLATNTYQESLDLGKTWSNISAEKVYYQFRYNAGTNTHLVSTDLGLNWTDVSSNKVYYQFRTGDNRLLVSTDLGTTWENCSEPIAAWFRWAEVNGTGNVGKVLISRDLLNWEDLSPVMTNNLYIKGYVSTIGNLPSNAAIGDIYMVGPTYDESDITLDYPHYRMWVKQSSGWVDNGEYLSNILIVLTTGLETGITMSLKAITNIINAEQERAEAAEKANALGVIYDVSAHNNGAVFKSLSALLSNSDLSTLIPTSVRYGGMTIRFIQGSEQSSDNKYVQYRLMTDTFSTTVTDWQGVDVEPIEGSRNLVESGGVYKSIKSRESINNSFVQLPLQKNKLLFSDNSFGNLSSPFGISIIFRYSLLYENVDVVLVGKGDYASNGWAIIKKPNASKYYFVLNGVEYKITSVTSGIDFIFSVINNDNNIYVYIFNKKVLSIEKEGVLDNDSYLQLGGNGSTVYTGAKWVCALFWYKNVGIDDCFLDINKIYNRKFSRIDISADFICCKQTWVNKGFVDGKYSLLNPNNITVTYSDIVKMPGDINILNSLYCFGGKIHKTFQGGTYGEEKAFFTTSFIDVSNFGKIIINKAAFLRFLDIDICTFYNNEKVEIKTVLSKTLTKDGTYDYDYDSLIDYKNKVIINIPSEAKYAQVCLGFDGYVEFEERDFEYIKPSIINIPKYIDRGFNKVPCIVFEASDYLSAHWITKKTWWDDKDGIEILESDGVNKTITISTEYLTYFTDNVVYNMVYETPDGEQDIMYLFRNTDDGVMHVLSDIVPPIGSLLYSHIRIEADGSSSGEMHLSTIAYRVLGKKIVESSHNIYNAQLTNRCGFYYSRQNLQTQQGVLKDINGNGCFYYNGKVIANWSQLSAQKTWGLRESTNCFYTSNQRSVYFKHKAPFKNGFYNIKAVAPRFFVNTQNVQLESYPVTLNVYNNNELIHTQPVCDYRPKRIIVALNREYSGNQIFNLNKEVGDVVYSTINAIISAIPQSERKLNMIVTAKIKNSNGLTRNEWTTIKFIGDTLEKFTNTNCWEIYEFDKVKIEFVGTNSADSLIAVQRIIQYDFSDDYFDMGINSPSLTQSNVGKPSLAGIIGDSWTSSADKPVTYEEPIKIFGEDGNRANDSYESRPLIRGMMEEGCPTDCWGIGTKTAMWAWIHQVRPFVQHTEYTHCVVEYFTNDGATDWYGAMPALVKILQENGIIPIVFAPISGREQQTAYLKAIL